MRAPPYHPATNGAAERFVQVLKKSLKWNSQLTIQHQLSNLLLSYSAVNTATHYEWRITCRAFPQTAAESPPVNDETRPKGSSPSQLSKRSRRSRTTTARRSCVPSLMPEETVAVRQFRGPHKWQRGVVVQRLGPTNYIVQVANRTLQE